LFLGIDLLGYLESCKKEMKDLDGRGIKASILFQPFAVPNKEFAEELIKNRPIIGLRAVHTREFNAFSIFGKQRMMNIA
jgi:hypothetical protein